MIVPAGRGCRMLGLTVLTLVSVASAASAQGVPAPVARMDGADVRIEALDARSGEASVALAYTLAPAVPEAPVAVRVLPVDGRSVTVLSAGPRNRRVGLAADADGMVRGVLPANVHAPGAVAPAGVTLTYGVDGAWVLDGDRFDLLVPVVTLDLPSSEARPGLVDLTLRLPAGSRVLESFPSTLRAEEREGTVVVTGQLSVMPALVRVRGRMGGGAFGGVRAAETAVLLLIVALGVLGWRYLTRSV